LPRKEKRGPKELIADGLVFFKGEEKKENAAE
jgi:hypothetical protein